MCAWASTSYNPQVPGVQLTYTLDDATKARRVGVWMRLNTSPFTGLIELRDSLFLRY
ncbi:MAG: hypothetical protein FJZ00_10110 [Candidatus Sericytochromatia bacterium]|uniref:Uncharacterized protein n=1 Tax=Candidatus Tanganyikabacteria bacterium TaxID=2961651 RepID=A0A937X447_9BACT|nr:hypothetical protein [Candidatus Tanganyikabacteria bacterium]